MALTVCLDCDESYGERLSHCPHCGTANYFSDPDPVVLSAAVHALCEQVEYEAGRERRAKLKDINSLRPPRWYHRLWAWLRENM